MEKNINQSTQVIKSAVEKTAWEKPELTSLGKVSSIVLTGGVWSCFHDDSDTFNPGCGGF